MTQIVLVNEKDEVIGYGDKMETHIKALLHRAFSVFIFRKSDKLEILLQKRDSEKYHCGNLWTNTCCGHPYPDESIEHAGQRRLFEEMGINISLKYKGVFHYTAKFENGLTENEIDHVLVGEYHNEVITPNPLEVSEYRWVTPEALKEEIKKQPNTFTPWLLPALELAL